MDLILVISCDIFKCFLPKHSNNVFFIYYLTILLKVQKNSKSKTKSKKLKVKNNSKSKNKVKKLKVKKQSENFWSKSKSPVHSTGLQGFLSSNAVPSSGLFFAKPKVPSTGNFSVKLKVPSTGDFLVEIRVPDTGNFPSKSKT
eukprot:UN28433